MKINKIKEKLKKLIKSDSDLRQEIAKLCSETLNSDEYNTLNVKDLEIIEDLSVMDEINGIKEPKILHIKIEEIKKMVKDIL